MIDLLSKYLPEKETVQNYFGDCRERYKKQKLEKAPPVTIICQHNGWTLDHLPSEIPLDEIKINGNTPSKGQISLANVERINEGDKITLAAKYAEILLSGYNNPKFREGIVRTGRSGLENAFPEEMYLSDRDNRTKNLTLKERKKLRKWRIALKMTIQVEGRRLPRFIPDEF